jgi:hypothetical protein
MAAFVIWRVLVVEAPWLKVLMDQEHDSSNNHQENILKPFPTSS